MGKKKDTIWLWIALFWIVISVISMFIGVISYTTAGGTTKMYAIQNLIDGETFSKEVLREYTGDFVLDVGPWALTALCILAVGAIIAALAGILIMQKQRPVKWPFVMTVIGVIGTAIPALLILYAVIVSVNYFPGKISAGFYPIVTPIAVAFCLYIVIRERKRVLKANAAIKQNAYIRPAGDL